MILSCERVILNFLQRMSGVATTTRKFVDKVAGTRARILDTRKTAPGLRVIDKYAVRCGGGQNHRLDLSDGILIKNNHIALAGGAVTALERAIRNRRGNQPIEIEVRSLDEMQQALEHGAEAILLDNMTVEDVRKAVEICSHLPRRMPLECSGGINPGERSRLRGNRRGLHLGRRTDALLDGGGYELASHAGLSSRWSSVVSLLRSVRSARVGQVLEAGR